MENVLYSPNTGNDFYYDRLKICPFCGGNSSLHFIGNDFTKSATVEIKCDDCRVKMVNATLNKYHNAEWIAKISIDNWNKRVY